MKWSQVMRLTVCMLGLSGCGALTSKTPTVEPDDYPLRSAALSKLPLAVPLSGSLPLARLLDRAREAGVIISCPAALTRDRDTLIPVSPFDSWWVVIQKVEYATGCVYEAATKSLREVTATHDVDSPDDFGRAGTDKPVSLALREIVVMRFRFVRGGANGSSETLALGASGEYVDFSAKLPAGVKRNWDVSSEKGYYNQAVTTQTNQPQTINTERKTDQAGVIFEGMAGTLPGGNFRLRASLEISAFTNGLDKNEVKIPLDYDGARSKWIRLFAFKAGNAGVVASLRGLGLRVNGSADTVSVWVRVD